MEQTYDVLRIKAEEALMAARQALDRELSEYPSPISGYESPLKQLLAERQRLAAALKELHATVFIPTARISAPRSGVKSR